MATNVSVSRKMLKTNVLPYPQVASGSGAPPAGARSDPGDLYVDTSARRLWVAIAADTWSVVNKAAFCHRAVTGDTTVTATDGTLGVSSETAVTITLPPVATFPESRTRITVVDEGGNAGSGAQISIYAAEGETVVGSNVYTLFTNYSSVSLYCTPDGWFVACAA